ncbi:MAG: hypothetical protein ACM3U2_15715 [Deltaproteobacteria bacterium]
MKSLARELKSLGRSIDEAAGGRDARGYFAAWRRVLWLFREENRHRTDPEPRSGEPEYKKLWELAGQALIELGGQAEPSLATVDQYDHLIYGPMLGVSDEGSAAAAIRKGALASPKCSHLRPPAPLTVGVAHDAERLGAIGEVVVGPQEYRDIRLACLGRILSTTNVGTRVNLRNFSDPPVVKIKSEGSAANIAAARHKLQKLFEPFWKTPSGRPRHLTVLLQFDEVGTPHEREVVFKKVAAAVASGAFCDPRVHRLGLAAVVHGEGRLEQARAAVALARRCGLDEIALDGRPLPVSGDVISLSGLLALFEPAELESLLRHAADNRVHVMAKQRVDPQTTARHVWASLMVARNMGMDLGKYGLLPLTFEQQKEVIARIQYWITDWCAAPVCYIDYPLVTMQKVYYGQTLPAGIKQWLDMVRDLRVRVVLIDTANKALGRHLLKELPDDVRGILSLDEIRDVDAHARKLKIKTLWAGGISVPQAWLFGRLGVFGVYVTTAAAALRPLSRRAQRDPGLAAEREPQPEAVARVKLLLEAGFLAGQFEKRGMRTEAEQLGAAARDLLALLEKPGAKQKEKERQEKVLHELATTAWGSHFAERVSERKPRSRSQS